jgi:uncharacterized membrane protein
MSDRDITMPDIKRERAPHDERVLKVELLISRLLGWGVLCSLAITLLGIGVTFARHPSYLTNRDELHALVEMGARFPVSLSAIARGVMHGQGRSIVLVGLLLLIATPVVRVAVSIVTFIYERDPRYVLITATVLALLLTSFFLGKAG